MIEFAIRMVILLITDATKMILLQTTEMIIVRIHFFLNLMMIYFGFLLIKEIIKQNIQQKNI